MVFNAMLTCAIGIPYCVAVSQAASLYCQSTYNFRTKCVASSSALRLTLTRIPIPSLDVHMPKVHMQPTHPTCAHSLTFAHQTRTTGFPTARRTLLGVCRRLAFVCVCVCVGQSREISRRQAGLCCRCWLGLTSLVACGFLLSLRRQRVCVLWHVSETYAHAHHHHSDAAVGPVCTEHVVAQTAAAAATTRLLLAACSSATRLLRGVCARVCARMSDGRRLPDEITNACWTCACERACVRACERATRSPGRNVRGRI